MKVSKIIHLNPLIGSFISESSLRRLESLASILPSEMKSKFAHDRQSLNVLKIPYHEIYGDKGLIEGQPGPGGLKVIRKILAPGVSIMGEYNEETSKFEGLGWFEDIPGHVEYYGGFKGSQKSGHGAFKFSNGDLYLGNFEEDEMNGVGTYYYCESGTVIKGNVFSKDGIIGTGKITWNDKVKYISSYEGEIKFGLPDGTGKINSHIYLFREMQME